MKKWIALVVAGVLCLGLMGGIPVMAQNEEQQFNENEIVLRFPAISDIHISGGAQTTKFLAALDQLNEKGPMDAILIGGDFTDFGLPDQVSDFCKALTSKVDLN